MTDPGSSAADQHRQREGRHLYRGKERRCQSCCSVSVCIDYQVISFGASIHSLLTSCSCFGSFKEFLSLPLIRVCVKVGVCVHGSPDSVLCQENVAEVYGFLHNSMNDYMVDSRGDVGAW